MLGDPGTLWFRTEPPEEVEKSWQARVRMPCVHADETARVARPSLRSLNLTRNTLCGTLKKNIGGDSFGATLERRMKNIEETGSAYSSLYGRNGQKHVVPSEELQERLSFDDGRRRW